MMSNLELPSRMSVCVRLFIESLLDEIEANTCVARVPEAQVSTCNGLVESHESEIRSQLVSHCASELSMAGLSGDSLCAVAGTLTSNSGKNRRIETTHPQAWHLLGGAQ